MDNSESKPQDVGGTEFEGGINQKYLTQDIIGPYSGIVYGRKGEKVKVINDSQIMVLVEQESKRYFVRMENLVNVDQSVPLENNLPDEKDKENKTVKPIELKQYSKPAARKVVKPSGLQPNNQTNLF
jgi:hypothetical protein